MKRRKRIIDATAKKPRELTRERGPRLEREPLTAKIFEFGLARQIARSGEQSGGA